MSTSLRHLRQVMLVEVGEAGQRRIGEATARVSGDGLAHEIAARYAEGAGFSAIAPGAVDVEAGATSAIVTTPAAREVLAGARATLAEIRRALREVRS